MKSLLICAAAAASIAYVVPALAQDAPAAEPQVRVEVHQGMGAHPMTRDAVAKMVQSHFTAMDANKDGFVTKAEMDSARDQMHSKMVTRFERRMGDHDEAMPDRGAIFDRLDANHDGTVSRDEFMSAKPMVQEKRVIVMNGDGVGHPGMGMRMHHMGMRFGGRIFEKADSNSDGKVSLQEATTAALAHFDGADSNHDGTLSPEEMRAAHKAMRASDNS